MDTLEIAEMECALMMSSMLEIERMKAGMTQQEVCQALDISYNVYKKMRKGNLHVSFCTVVRTLSYFGLRIKFVKETGSLLPSPPPPNMMMKDLRRTKNRIKMR